MKADTYREHLTALQVEIEELRAKLAAYQSTMGQLSGAAQSTKAGDLISRAAAIEVAKQHWYKPDIAGALAELPSAQLLVLTCDGCRHVGTYDTDFPCSGCIRREKDYYEQER